MIISWDADNFLGGVLAGAPGTPSPDRTRRFWSALGRRWISRACGAWPFKRGTGQNQGALKNVGTCIHEI
jgi:hypothetical protein